MTKMTATQRSVISDLATKEANGRNNFLLLHKRLSPAVSGLVDAGLVISVSEPIMNLIRVSFTEKGRKKFVKVARVKAKEFKGKPSSRIKFDKTEANFRFSSFGA